MQEEHQHLIQEFEESKKTIEKAKKMPLAIEALVVLIVVSIKFIQETASLQLNVIATSSVLLLLFVYFWGFYPRRALYEQQTAIVLKGLELEKNNPFHKLSFFRDYMKSFSVLGSIAGMVLFDFFLLYFTSVSFTQLIKSINPESLVKLRPLKHFTTPFISFVLGWAYYQSIRPLAKHRESLS